MTWSSEAAEAEYEADTERWVPAGAVADSIVNWQQFLSDYWGLSADSPPDGAAYASWEEVRRCKHLSQSLLRALTQMPIPEPSALLDREQLAGLRRDLQSLSKIWLLNQLLELGLLQRVLNRATGAGERATRLLGQVQIGDLPVKAQSYLRRACELYLAGFDAEVAIMARAALEAAVRDRLVSSSAIRSDERIDLETLLNKACGVGVLRGQQSDGRDQQRDRDTPFGLAHELRKAGNYAAHKSLEYKPADDGLANPFEVIRALSKVLDDLYRPEGP